MHSVLEGAACLLKAPSFEQFGNTWTGSRGPYMRQLRKETISIACVFRVELQTFEVCSEVLLYNKFFILGRINFCSSYFKC